MVSVASRDAKGRFTKAEDDEIPTQYRTTCSRCGRLKDMRCYCTCVPQAEIDAHFAAQRGFPDSSTEREARRQQLLTDPETYFAEARANAFEILKSASDGAKAQVKPRFRRWSWRKRR